MPALLSWRAAVRPPPWPSSVLLGGLCDSMVLLCNQALCVCRHKVLRESAEMCRICWAIGWTMRCIARGQARASSLLRPPPAGCGRAAPAQLPPWTEPSCEVYPCVFLEQECEFEFVFGSWVQQMCKIQGWEPSERMSCPLYIMLSGCLLMPTVIKIQSAQQNLILPSAHKQTLLYLMYGVK